MNYQDLWLCLAKYLPMEAKNGDRIHLAGALWEHLAGGWYLVSDETGVQQAVLNQSPRSNVCFCVDCCVEYGTI